MEKLSKQFNEVIRPALYKELGNKNYFQTPKINKVVLSAGIGDFKEDDAMIKSITEQLSRIAGQKPMLNLARKAVSAFKLRIGQPVGLTVTLRGEMMYDFIDRLINVSLPRVRDFRGISRTAFDGHGNYCIGIKESAIFPEIKYEDMNKPFGMQINVNTSAKNDADALALLTALGFPFEKNNKEKNG